MNKKTIIIIASVALAVILAIVGSVFLFNSLFSGEKSGDNVAKITVEEVTGEKDKTVLVDVKMNSNPGFMASLMDISYDTAVMEYIGYDKGDVIEDYQFEENEKGLLKFLNLENEDVSKTGTLFTLKFKIKGDSGAKSDVKIDITDIINYNEEDIAYKVTNGSVTVK